MHRPTPFACARIGGGSFAAMTSIPADTPTFDAIADAPRRRRGLAHDQPGGRALHDAARPLVAGRQVVEIGSFRGRSTTVLGLDRREGVQVVAIDPHAGNDAVRASWTATPRRPPRGPRGVPRQPRAAGITGRVRHLRAFSHDALADVEGDIDVLFIDGAHRYRPALDDVLQWGARVPIGGTLLIHDAFSSIGVTLGIGRALLSVAPVPLRGRAGSLAVYRAEPPASTADRLANAGRQLAQLPWFARNVVIKALIVLHLGRVTRLLGHTEPTWPYSRGPTPPRPGPRPPPPEARRASATCRRSTACAASRCSASWPSTSAGSTAATWASTRSSCCRASSSRRCCSPSARPDGPYRWRVLGAARPSAAAGRARHGRRGRWCGGVRRPRAARRLRDEPSPRCCTSPTGTTIDTASSYWAHRSTRAVAAPAHLEPGHRGAVLPGLAARRGWWPSLAVRLRRRLAAGVGVVATVRGRLVGLDGGAVRPGRRRSAPTSAPTAGLGAMSSGLCWRRCCGRRAASEPGRPRRPPAGCRGAGGVGRAGMGAGSSWKTPPVALPGRLRPARPGRRRGVAAACRPSGSWRRGLAWTPLRALGLISYGLYLWHWVVIAILTEARTGLHGLSLDLVQLVLSLAAALASYWFLEQPIRARRWLAPRSWRPLSPSAPKARSSARRSHVARSRTRPRRPRAAPDRRQHRGLGGRVRLRARRPPPRRPLPHR